MLLSETSTTDVPAPRLSNSTIAPAAGWIDESQLLAFDHNVFEAPVQVTVCALALIKLKAKQARTKKLERIFMR